MDTKTKTIIASVMLVALVAILTVVLIDWRSNRSKKPLQEQNKPLTLEDRLEREFSTYKVEKKEAYEGLEKMELDVALDKEF